MNAHQHILMFSLVLPSLGRSEAITSNSSTSSPEANSVPEAVSFSNLPTPSATSTTPLAFYDDLYFSEDKQGPQIVRHSHFSQSFRLGYKLQMMCEAEGNPRPHIVWYKNGAEISPYKTINIEEKNISNGTLRSSLTIEPATLIDKGIYGCLASNIHGFHLKSIKAIYTF